MEIVDLPRKYVTPALFVGYTLASLHLVLTFGADVVAHFWIRTLCYQVSGANQGCTTLAEVASPVLTVMWYAMLMSFAIFLVDTAAEVIRDLAHYGEAGPLTEPSSDTTAGFACAAILIAILTALISLALPAEPPATPRFYDSIQLYDKLGGGDYIIDRPGGLPLQNSEIG